MVLRTNFINITQSYVPPSRPKKWMKSTHKSLVIWHIIAAFLYVCCSSRSARGMEMYRLVDLSHTFDKSTLYWVGQKPLTLTVTYNGTVSSGQHWYQSDEIETATHGGTHMDSPCHFAKGRWCIADIPVERLVSPASVVDISHEVNGNPSVVCSKKHLTDWERTFGKIPKKSLLLIYTGWSKFWPDASKYRGTTEDDVSLLKFPSIDPEAAKWLVSERDVVGVGIDTMSVDTPGGTNQTHVLSENNIYQLENVNNMNLLPSKGATVYALPMKLDGASGASCRILAQVPTVTSGCSVNTSCFNVAVLGSIICIALFQWLRVEDR